jgi:E3 ubiquitin-protein ligase listerin
MMIPGKDASWVLSSIFPPKSTLERLFAEEIAVSPDPILAAGDLLVPEEELEDLRTHTFDRQQLSSYTRLVWALTFLASTDRQVAKTNMWILKHSLLLQQLAEDRLQTTRSQMSSFGPDISQSFLLKIVESARMLTVYLFSGVSSSDLPHGSMVNAIDEKTTLTSADIVGFITDLCRSSVNSDCPKFARIVRSVLGHALRGVSTTDADRWLTLSRKITRTGMLAILDR